ncbi:MAG: Mur ligase family protein [Patescibacteria group bacterium]
MKLFAIIIWLLLVTRKILFWAQLWQQKEYRLDRIVIYLKNKRNLRSWLGYNVIFNQGLKRPFFTTKATLLTVASFIVSAIIANLFLPTDKWWLGLLISYLIIPLTVAFFVLCLSIPSYIAKQIIIEIAKIKIKTRKSPLTVIGITGSYGKTSTKQLLEHVLKTKYKVFATGQSHNTLFSVASDIIRYLSDEQTHAIIEYGAYKRGEIKRLTELIKPQIAVITGISKQHYGLFGSYENLKMAKFELIESLSKNGLALINCDDNETQKLRTMAGQSSINWSCFETKKWKAGEFKIINGNLNFHLQADGKKLIINTGLPGSIYKENIKAVLALAERFNIPADITAESLNNFKPSDHFVSQSTGLNKSMLLDDGGTSNPKGFASAIQIAKDLKYPKKILVTSGIVDLGDASDQVHEELGMMANQTFSMVLYTGPDGYDSFLKGWDKLSGNKPILRIMENSDLEKLQNEIDENTLVLIEGRLPARVTKLLKSI